MVLIKPANIPHCAKNSQKCVGNSDVSSSVQDFHRLHFEIVTYAAASTPKEVRAYPQRGSGPVSQAHLERGLRLDLLIRHVDITCMSILNRVKNFLIQGFLILYMYDSWRSSSMKYFNVSNLLEESNLLLLSCLNWSSKRVLNNLWKEELAMKGLSQTSPNPWVFNKAWMHCTQLCFSWIAVLYASFTSLLCVPVVIRNQYLIAMDQALWDMNTVCLAIQHRHRNFPNLTATFTGFLCDAWYPDT